ncbi:hypothetical protein SMITH_553 [Smithella sp. ME-1]|uniref:Uncharacterized protein n=1 Tax=hydrocarbon metagenome TaxID=938273 RepID=A0A0W8FN14_9ZZZZ|nr:hypothetical protein SMITH_553 [Smithella sp. ME-1]
MSFVQFSRLHENVIVGIYKFEKNSVCSGKNIKKGQCKSAPFLWNERFYTFSSTMDISCLTPKHNETITKLYFDPLYFCQLKNTASIIT